MPDGKGNVCLACHRKTKLAWEHSRLETVRAQQRERAPRYRKTKRAWYLANQEHVRELARIRRIKNREHIREIQRKGAHRRYAANPHLGAAKRAAYRLSDHTRYRAKMRDYRNRNLARERERRIKRYNLERGATVVDFTDQQWHDMKEAYQNRCAYCGKQTSELERDHIVPLTRGGQHTRSNILPACKSCNSRKGNRTLEQMGMRIVVRMDD